MTLLLASPNIAETNPQPSTPMTSSEMIDLLGGTTAVARILNVKPPSVHAWRTSGIPDDKLIRLAPSIERATNGAVGRRDLRPDDWADIWPELAAGAQPAGDSP